MATALGALDGAAVAGPARGIAGDAAHRRILRAVHARLDATPDARFPPGERGRALGQRISARARVRGRGAALGKQSLGRAAPPDRPRARADREAGIRRILSRYGRRDSLLALEGN